MGSTIPWVHCSMGPLFHGSTVPWVHYSMGPLFHGSTVPRVHCSKGPLFHGSTVPWVHCSMGPLFHGSTVPWVHCSMGPLFHGVHCSNLESTTLFHGVHCSMGWVHWFKTIISLSVSPVVHVVGTSHHQAYKHTPIVWSILVMIKHMYEHMIHPSNSMLPCLHVHVACMVIAKVASGIIAIGDSICIQALLS